MRAEVSCPSGMKHRALRTKIDIMKGILQRPAKVVPTPMPNCSKTGFCKELLNGVNRMMKRQKTWIARRGRARGVVSGRAEPLA